MVTGHADSGHDGRFSLIDQGERAMRYHHIPVMVEEVIRYLNCSPGKTFVDGTLGGGGHARAILRVIGPEGFLIGIDQDPDAIAWARHSFLDSSSNIQLIHDNYASLRQILAKVGSVGVDGILFDLGLSLYHIEGSGRGFSFMRDEPLDMRMNPSEGEPASTMLNRLSQEELSDIIFRYGEERWAPSIAKRIVESRKRKALVSSHQLAALVKKAIPARYHPKRIHPATKTFQAFRIAVNDELENLKLTLEQAVDCLLPRGRICVLSFHSLEDRIVKQHFKTLAQGCQCPPSFPVCVCDKKPQVRLLTKRPVRATADEIKKNSMARSAKLRAVERLDGSK